LGRVVWLGYFGVRVVDHKAIVITGNGSLQSNTQETLVGDGKEFSGYVFQW
jgi:hypothetical protein